MSNAISALIKKAICFAVEAHGDQVRKTTGSPYVMHPIAVGRMLADYDCEDSTVVAAAILHDVLEDTPVTAEGLRQEFGHEVFNFVLEVTEPEKELSYFKRKQRTIAHVYSMSLGAKLIKVADMIDNLRSDDLCLKLKDCGLGAGLFWDKLRGGRDGTHWYHRMMNNALGRDLGDESRYTRPELILQQLVQMHDELIDHVWPDIVLSSAREFEKSAESCGA